MSGRTLRFDRSMLGIVMGLTALGIIMIYSSSAVLAMQKKGAADYFFVRQCFWVGVGLIGMLVALKIPHTFWQQRRVVIALISAEALLLLIALLGPAINGSHRWIKLGPLTMQPSESAKLVLVIFAAYTLEKRAREKKEWLQAVAKIGVYAAFLAAAIVVQPDLGTVVVLGIVLLVMLFLDGLPWRWLAVLAGCAAIALVVLIVSSPYRYQRLMTYLHPERDPQRAGFQARQSLIAVGSGGLTGKWIGGGSQKLLFLPEPHTDFIYSMIGEELGLVGTSLVLLGFLALGYRGIVAIRSAPDHFSQLVATGILVWIVAQAMLHIGVTLTLLPTKGLPLPLLSYGGSSLVVTLTSVGILMNVSQYE